MPYQTDHTHHTYPTYHTTPPPHHRGRRGKISSGASIWDPSHGGVAGPGAYIYIYCIHTYTLFLHVFAMLAVSRVNPSTSTMPWPLLSNWFWISWDLAKVTLLLVLHRIIFIYPMEHSHIAEFAYLVQGYPII